MTKLFAILLLLLLPAAAPGTVPPRTEPSQDEQKATFVLIVHADNAFAGTVDEAKATIKKLYLKDLLQWPGGVEARPYARERQVAEQIAFVKDVLGMTDAELARHWLRMKNTNGTTPPKDVDSERLLLKFVARNAGAFGVVRKEAVGEGQGVRVLFEF